MKFLLVFFIGLIALNSCDHNNNPFVYQKDAHGRGKAKILVEQSFQPLFETSIETFMSQYPRARIKANYLTENEIIEAFYANQSKTIVITRDFNDKEKAYLKSKNVSYRSDKIATDAVVIIMHPSMTDTILSIDHITNLLRGDKVSLASSTIPSQIVFDQNGSANFNFMVNMLQIKELGKNITALNSNQEVIKYVKTHPGTMGIIGLNWISDQDDPTSMAFIEGLKIAAVYDTDPETACKPYAGFIYTKEYPLIRDIWMINKGRRSGLNTGFVLFMKKDDKGQLIIQKSGLVPALTPVRLVLQ